LFTVLQPVSGVNFDVRFQITGTPDHLFRVDCQDGVTEVATAADAWVLDTEHEIVVTADPTADVVTLFVDGVQAAQCDGTGTHGTPGRIQFLDTVNATYTFDNVTTYEGAYY
jgi:hypothetical protein